MGPPGAVWKSAQPERFGLDLPKKSVDSRQGTDIAVVAGTPLICREKRSDPGQISVNGGYRCWKLSRKLRGQCRRLTHEDGSRDAERQGIDRRRNSSVSPGATTAWSAPGVFNRYPRASSQRTAPRTVFSPPGWRSHRGLRLRPPASAIAHTRRLDSSTINGTIRTCPVHDWDGGPTPRCGATWGNNRIRSRKKAKAQAPWRPGRLHNR